MGLEKLVCPARFERATLALETGKMELNNSSTSGLRKGPKRAYIRNRIGHTLGGLLLNSCKQKQRQSLLEWFECHYKDLAYLIGLIKRYLPWRQLDSLNR